jgi:PAS domain S-box-containing protein
MIAVLYSPMVNQGTYPTAEKPTYEALERRVIELTRRLSELRRLERTLLESERKYRELVQAVNSIILRFDTQGNITFFNEFAQRFFGFSKDEALGKNIVGTIVPRTDSAGRDLALMIRRLIADPENHVANENENIRKSGERVWVTWTNRAIHNTRQQVVEILAVGNDISARKKTEQELVRLATVVEQVAESIMITDRRGDIIYINPAFEHISGFSRTDVIGKNFRILKSDKHDESFYRRMWQTISSGRVWKGRIVNRMKASELREFETTISPIRDNSADIVNFVSINRDVTSELDLESRLRQAQKMEAIGTLAGGIAHDFNNILSAIIGYAELSKMDVAQGSLIQNNLAEILKAGNRAKDLVNQILTFSRRSEPERKPVRIGQIVNEALKMLRASLPTTIDMRASIDDDVGVIEADTTQVHQILMNLCTNAGHAMRDTGGILEVTLSNAEIDELMASRQPDLIASSYLKLSVTDTGSGMTEEVAHRIFEPYFTTKEKGVGTGMGLAVVHGIVRSYGGAITVDSAPGRGSTFNVYLPRILKTAAPVDERSHVYPTGHERILCVDDEQTLVDVAEQMLAKLGFQVITSTSSVEALKLFQTQPDDFDLVITDLTMPNLTGDRLAAELTKIRPDVPVILCSGYSEHLTGKQLRETGIRSFLMKPLLIGDLATTVRRILDEK